MLGNRAAIQGLEAELAEQRRVVATLQAERLNAMTLDAPTGLLSFRAFRSRLAEEIERARRARHPVTLGILEITNYRRVEIEVGFTAADELLVAVARLLGTWTRGQDGRAHDILARVQGGQFALLMPATSLGGGLTCLERLLLALESVQVPPLHGVSASAGVAGLQSGLSAEGLFGHALSGLDMAIAAGGHRAMAASGAAIPELVREHLHRDTIEALAVALLERDRYTGEHSESVVEMAADVARNLGLRGEEVDDVRAASLLHDIGKVAIPDHILNKPAKLDADEWEMMKQHPVIGERILRAVPGLGPVARIVRHEHESFDGSGYPDGLSGSAIPIGSRIILACDTYHAMTSDRPYRKALPHAVAVEELHRCAGSQFDPDVTAALIGVLYGARQTGVLAA